MLRPVLRAIGAEAAAQFYDPALLTRRGAMPPSILRLLQDKGSMQMLDDTSHRHRRGAFAGLLMTDEAEARFLAIFRDEWQRALPE